MISLAIISTSNLIFEWEIITFSRNHNNNNTTSLLLFLQITVLSARYLLIFNNHQKETRTNKAQTNLCLSEKLTNQQVLTEWAKSIKNNHLVYILLFGVGEVVRARHPLDR